MPISVTKLKEMDEENCFYYRPSILASKIIEFLIQNKNKAYFASEIHEELSLKGNEKFTKSSVSGNLLNMSKKEKTGIKKKGSYYYWEDTTKE